MKRRLKIILVIIAAIVLVNYLPLTVGAEPFITLEKLYDMIKNLEERVSRLEKSGDFLPMEEYEGTINYGEIVNYAEIVYCGESFMVIEHGYGESREQYENFRDSVIESCYECGSVIKIEHFERNANMSEDEFKKQVELRFHELFELYNDRKDEQD